MPIKHPRDFSCWPERRQRPPGGGIHMNKDWENKSREVLKHWFPLFPQQPLCAPRYPAEVSLPQHWSQRNPKGPKNNWETADVKMSRRYGRYFVSLFGSLGTACISQALERQLTSPIYNHSKKLLRHRCKGTLHWQNSRLPAYPCPSSEHHHRVTLLLQRRTLLLQERQLSLCLHLPHMQNVA